MNKLIALCSLALLSVAACGKSQEAAKPADKPAEPAAPAAAPIPTPSMAPAAPEAAKAGSIVDIAIANGNFKTLATALTAAGLVDTLKGPGPFTVFAPTDEAFAKIPKADLDALLADKEKLTAVLTYHVVAGKVMAADVGKLKAAKTVHGAEVAIDTSAGVKIGGATVTAADIAADNGVIHVIDTVLLPPAK